MNSSIRGNNCSLIDGRYSEADRRAQPSPSFAGQEEVILSGQPMESTRRTGRPYSRSGCVKTDRFRCERHLRPVFSRGGDYLHSIVYVYEVGETTPG